MNLPLLKFTGYSIHCPQAGIHIDPWKPVEKAIITHAHSDHAKYGSRHYLAHKDSETILRMRLGSDISLQTVEYGEVFTINGVRISLHPAGHILGSAQVRLEKDGDVWVASGDYKLQDDNFSQKFEPIKCNVFITESTFGLPVYKWQHQTGVFNEIRQWWQQNIIEGKTSILMGYALGKMQRIITNLMPFESPVFAHGAIYNINESLRKAGHNLPYIKPVSGVDDKTLFRNSLILAPSSALNSPWMKKFSPFSTAYCSGWMAIRGAKSRQGTDRGFVLSDHADWNELNFAVKETGAEKVFVTHGYTEVFARWLREHGVDAAEVITMYGNEQEELLAESKSES